MTSKPINTIQLVLGEEHEDAGQVIDLYRGHRSVSVYGPDDEMGYVSLAWSDTDEMWEVREGTLEPTITFGELHLADTLGEAFSVFRAQVRDMYPYKRVAFKASAAGLR
jgi:hypothetical protein